MPAGVLSWGHFLPLGAAAVLLLGGCSGSASHSLRYLIAMWAPDQFVASAYLDDQLLMRYDSNTRTTLPRVPWMKKVEEGDPDFWKWQSWGASHLEKKFTEDVATLQKRSNRAGEFYTFQRIALCDLSKDGQKGALMRYGYNGSNLLHFERENLTWTAADALAQVLKEEWDADVAASQRSKAFLEETCIELLQQYLGYGKESLLRRDPPVAKVVRKPVTYESLETYVCRAHGFYPKEITISWRKDGEVWEEDTFHGGLTPNSDGTYHTWLSIQMHPKDRDRFRCHVEHAGLLHPLDVAWKEASERPQASTWPIVGSILGAAAALLLVSGILRFLKTVGGLRSSIIQRPGLQAVKDPPPY